MRNNGGYRDDNREIVYAAVILLFGFPLVLLVLDLMG
jgi:hypothetical protein